MPGSAAICRCRTMREIFRESMRRRRVPRPPSGRASTSPPKSSRAWPRLRRPVRRLHDGLPAEPGDASSRSQLNKVLSRRTGQEHHPQLAPVVRFRAVRPGCTFESDLPGLFTFAQQAASYAWPGYDPAPQGDHRRLRLPDRAVAAASSSAWRSRNWSSPAATISGQSSAVNWPLNLPGTGSQDAVDLKFRTVSGAFLRTFPGWRSSPARDSRTSPRWRTCSLLQEFMLNEEASHLGATSIAPVRPGRADPDRAYREHR